MSTWTQNAWNNSAKWVSKAWGDSSGWVVTNWDHFILWVNTITSGDPFGWIESVVLDNGILAYENYAELRTFLNTKPNEEQVRQRCTDILSELSLLEEDKATLWEMLCQWANEKKVGIN